MKTVLRNILFGDDAIIPHGGSDPFADDVVLYIKGNGADGGTVFSDSSQYNHTVTRFGAGNEIVTSTTQAKYGTSSLYSPSNIIDTCLDIANSEVFDIAAQDFTLEFWYYKLSNTYISGITQLFTLDGLDFPLCIYDGGVLGNKPTAYLGTNSVWISIIHSSTESGAIPLNTWLHVAFCRKDGVLRGFLQGVIGTEVADTSTIPTGSANPTLLGSRGTDFYGAIQCYMSHFRFTMAGRYDANFNPETDIYME